MGLFCSASLVCDCFSAKKLDELYRRRKSPPESKGACSSIPFMGKRISRAAMKTIKSLQVSVVLAFALALMTGCAGYKPNVDFSNPGSLVGKINEHFKTEQLRYNCYGNGKDFASPTANNPLGCASSIQD